MLRVGAAGLLTLRGLSTLADEISGPVGGAGNVHPPSMGKLKRLRGGEGEPERGVRWPRRSSAGEARHRLSFRARPVRRALWGHSAMLSVRSWALRSSLASGLVRCALAPRLRDNPIDLLTVVELWS